MSMSDRTPKNMCRRAEGSSGCPDPFAKQCDAAYAGPGYNMPPWARTHSSTGLR